MSDELVDLMMRNFKSLPEAQQRRVVMLGLNAEFVLRMTAGTSPETEVGKAILSTREALTRYVPTPQS